MRPDVTVRCACGKERRFSEGKNVPWGKELKCPACGAMVQFPDETAPAGSLRAGLEDAMFAGERRASRAALMKNAIVLVVGGLVLSGIYLGMKAGGHIP